MKSILKKSLYLIMVFCLLFLCVGLTTSVSAADETSSQEKTIEITCSDEITPAIPTSASQTPTIHAKGTFSFSVVSVYDKSSYWMFSQNAGFLYSNTDLGYISSVAITYSSGTSTSAKIGVIFGTKELSNKNNDNHQTIAGRSKTDTFSNQDTTCGYFQISTSNKNTQITKIVITYHEGDVSDNVTVKFDTQGGSTVANKVVKKGSTFEKPADPTKSGYEFVGWFTEADEAFDFSTPITTDITLYAKWKEISWYNYSLLETNASLSISYSTKSFVSSVKYFEKVNEVLEDYSGTYLIVYEAGKKAFNGLDATNGNISVNIKEDNTILESDEVNTCKVLIEKVESGEGYSIQLIGANNTNKYIGKAAYSNGMDIEGTVLVNTISVENGVATIKGAGGSEIKYNDNSGQNRFRYYKSGQQPVALYKLSDNEKTSTTESFTFANASLRFGIINLPVSEYEKLVAENAEFGIALAKGNAVDLDSAKKVVCTPVRVNANGEEDPSGEYYQFAVVIDDITEADYDKEVTGVAYVKIGEEYHTVQESKTFSVKTIAKYYVDLYNASTTSEDVKAALEQHIDALKALAY